MNLHVFMIRWIITTAALKYYDSVTEIYHDTQYAPLALYHKINLLVDRNRDSEALTRSTKIS